MPKNTKRLLESMMDTDTQPLEDQKKARKFVREVVASQEEKKVQEYTVPAFYLANPVNTTGFTAQNVWELTNSESGSQSIAIAQGTGQGNRIGNKIKITKSLLRIILSPYPYATTYNTNPAPQDVRIVMFKLKGPDRGLTEAATCFSTTGNCFQSNNTSAGLDGTYLDCIRKLNKDVLTVYYDKVVKVGMAANTDAASGGTAAYGWFANNDYKFNQFLEIDMLKNGYPKQFQYNDTSTSPYGYNPLYIAIIPSNCNGGAHANTTNARALYASYQIDVEFTDA